MADTPIDVPLDLAEQSIIKADSERTRGGVLTSDEQQTIEKMLTMFCKESRIRYKQGLNEICGPFLLMCRAGVSPGRAYLLFKQFVKGNLATMFSDEVSQK
jgi:hypothetical protein